MAKSAQKCYKCYYNMIVWILARIEINSCMRQNKDKSSLWWDIGCWASGEHADFAIWSTLLQFACLSAMIHIPPRVSSTGRLHIYIYIISFSYIASICDKIYYDMYIWHPDLNQWLAIDLCIFLKKSHKCMVKCAISPRNCYEHAFFFPIFTK